MGLCAVELQCTDFAGFSWQHTRPGPCDLLFVPHVDKVWPVPVGVWLQQSEQLKVRRRA
jgi:hypothetical protein